MTTAATQDRACSTSLMNKGGRSIKRLATSVYGGTFRTWLDVRVASAMRSKTDIAMVDRNSQQAIRLFFCKRDSAKVLGSLQRRRPTSR
jgi:hypothetical protein